MTPHSVGFRIQAGERSIGYATDLGTVTAEIWQGLLGADLVLLESNYEPRLLDISSYPYYLRRRIASDHGHLSNPECADAVRRLAQEGTGRFVLAHLSRENNTPELAAGAAHAALADAGMEEGRDFLLTVANRLTVTGPILF